MYYKARRNPSTFRDYKEPRLSGPIEEAFKTSSARAGEEATVAAMAAVIQAQVNKGQYISEHLTGRAFDVRNRTMNGCEREAFELMINLVLGPRHLIKHELGGEPHFHVQL